MKHDIKATPQGPFHLSSTFSIPQKRHMPNASFNPSGKAPFRTGRWGLADAIEKQSGVPPVSLSGAGYHKRRFNSGHTASWEAAGMKSLLIGRRLFPDRETRRPERALEPSVPSRDALYRSPCNLSSEGNGLPSIMVGKNVCSVRNECVSWLAKRMKLGKSTVNA